MRALLIYLFTIGIFIAGGYAGLSWLTRPPTIGHTVSPQQNAARSSKETSPSHTTGAAQQRSSETAHGIDQLKAAGPSTERAAPPEQAPSVGRDHLQTVGLSHEHIPAGTNRPDPRSPSTVAPPTETSRMTENNGAGPRKVRLSSRIQREPHRQRRLVEMLNNPLTFDCMSCLLFGNR
jgi:hypothetical protein